ncbi:MAG: hypothetical protein DLM68_09970 [Hyphomicrobiales bacterium]|nr:MAG: hypothetical protein DLM68_09970 [Hyphomicrobiales bacterium]
MVKGAFDGRPICNRVGGPELFGAAMDGSGVNPEAKEAPAPAGARPVVPAGAQPASSESPGLSHPTGGAGADESAARDERAAMNSSPFIMQDHLAVLDAPLERLEPLLRAGTFVRTGLRGLAKIVRFPLTLDDARFRSERLVFESSRSVFMRRVDFPTFAGHLRRSFGAGLDSIDGGGEKTE